MPEKAGGGVGIPECASQKTYEPCRAHGLSDAPLGGVSRLTFFNAPGRLDRD